MANTIKVIDLLNKIANGEYPKKFKYNDKVYEYKRIIQGTGYVTDGYDWFNSDIYIDDWDNLNDTVEIIEKQQDIDIQKIEELPKDIDKFGWSDVGEKINIILQWAKQLDRNIKDKE